MAERARGRKPQGRKAPVRRSAYPSRSLAHSRSSPSKFPEVEEELVKWLIEVTEGKQVLTDAAIRTKAKEVARILQIPEDKFKASSGWIENFKHRHGIRRGIWYGDGKNTRVARAVGAGALPEDDESDDEHPRKIMPSVAMTNNMGMFRIPQTESERAGSVAPSTYSGDMDMSGEQQPEGEPVELQPAWQHATPSESPPSATWQSQPPADASSSGNPLDSIAPHWGALPEQTAQWRAATTVTNPLPTTVEQLEKRIAQEEEASSYNGPTPILNYHPSIHDPLLSTEPPRGVFDGQPATLSPSEAETYVDRLISFVDSHPGMLKHEERLALRAVKVAVFNAQNNAGYAA